MHPADRAGSTEASEEEPRSGSGSNAGPQQDAADGSGSGLSSTEPCLNGVDVRPGRGASAGEGAAARPAQRRGSAERGILRKSLATSVQREAVKGYLIHRCARMHACRALPGSSVHCCPRCQDSRHCASLHSCRSKARRLPIPH